MLPRSLPGPLITFLPATRTVRVLSIPRCLLAPDTLRWVGVRGGLPSLVALLVVGDDVPAAEVGRGHTFAHYCGWGAC